MRALALLLVLAFLTGCAGSRAAQDETESLRRDLDAAYDEIERLRAENQDLDYRLRQALDGVAQGQDRGITVAVLQSDIFFESGSAELLPQAASRLADVARRIQTEYAGRDVRVEGYTDSQPIGPALRAQYPTNWELSAARAASVARYLQQQHGLDPRRVEIVGFGEYRPLASNASAEGRQENRRVRVAVMGE